MLAPLVVKVLRRAFRREPALDPLSGAADQAALKAWIS